MKISLYLPQAIYELGQRENQEDSIYPEAGAASVLSHLFLVCDGMGGHSKGEVASNIVCQQMGKYLQAHLDAALPIDDHVLVQALQAAYIELDKEDDGSPYKMGTTLTLLCCHSKGCTVAHIGDSRIYHIRPKSKKILYKSRDHSLVYDMFVAGAMSFEEMATSPLKNQITRAIQPGEENRVKPDIVHIADIQKDDYFFLCSDGMLETVTDEQLLEIICSGASDEAIKMLLIEMSQTHADNHSAYLIHVENIVSEPGDIEIADDECSSPYNALRYEARVEEPSDVRIVSSPVRPRINKTQHKVKNIKSNRISLLYVILFLLALLAGIFFVFHGKSDSAKPKGNTLDYYNDFFTTPKPVHQLKDTKRVKNGNSAPGAEKVIPVSQNRRSTKTEKKAQEKPPVSKQTSLSSATSKQANTITPELKNKETNQASQSVPKTPESQQESNSHKKELKTENRRR